MKFKLTKNKAIAALLIMIVLAASFWYGGGAPGLQGWRVSPSSSNEAPAVKEEQDIQVPDIANDINIPSPDAEQSEADNASKTNMEEDAEEKPVDEFSKPEDTIPTESIEPRPGGTEGGLSADEKLALVKELAGGTSSSGVEKGSKIYSQAQGMVIDAVTGKDKYLTEPVPEGKPVPVEPQNVEISDVEYTCTLSVKCSTILDNISWLDKEKVELVPDDGVIFPATEVTFYEGESVFNVLQREMKKAKIHMEFSNVPVYNSVYIEGINNLYEFDCGELSGWMYKVNEWFPNYGCSRYQLKDGDIVEWVYTCNLGVDVGGYYAVGE